MNGPVETGNGRKPIENCARCHQPHITRHGGPSCIGHVTKEDEQRPCRNDPNHGTRVCHAHGASASQVKAAAARRVAVEKAAKIMRTYGVPTEGEHWTRVLPDELRWSVAHVRWLRVQLQAVSPEALVWGVADELDRGSGEFPGVDVRKAAMPSAWLELYHRERRYLLDVVKALGATDAIERSLRIAEREGELLVRFISGVLDDLGLSDEQTALVKLVVPRHLRALSGPGVIEGTVK